MKVVKKTIKNKDIVISGQYLGVVEEFLPDDHSTYVSNGAIYASKTGLINIDVKRREVEVKTHQDKDRKTVKIGDLVIGTIVFLRKYSVGISFFAINGKVHFNSSYFGNIHVSQISNKYIDKITDAFQITDILRAKVIKKNFNEFTLSTVGRDVGVIHADCVICGSTLNKVGLNKLTCPLCENVETRKLSSDYNNVTENLRF